MDLNWWELYIKKRYVYIINTEWKHFSWITKLMVFTRYTHFDEQNIYIPIQFAIAFLNTVQY